MIILVRISRPGSWWQNSPITDWTLPASQLRRRRILDQFNCHPAHYYSNSGCLTQDTILLCVAIGSTQGTSLWHEYLLSMSSVTILHLPNQPSRIGYLDRLPLAYSPLEATSNYQLAIASHPTTPATSTIFRQPAICQSRSESLRTSDFLIWWYIIHLIAPISNYLQLFPYRTNAALSTRSPSQTPPFASTFHAAPRTLTLSDQRANASRPTTRAPRYLEKTERLPSKARRQRS